MTHELLLDIAKTEWMSANQRLHWRVRSTRTRRIRTATAEAAVLANLPGLQRAHITAHIAYPRDGRADPANAAPTVKAMVDGLVDAGVIPDDDHTHLTGPDYRRDPKTGRPGTWTIRLEITEVPA